MEKIDVLNAGYVRLIDSMGSDLSVVNSARVSYDKAVNELGASDEKLIKFLATHGHTSPFRHATLQFEVYAPLMVARQHWKYIIGSAHQDPMVAWNESSRRYITEENQYYTPKPNEWRSKPENSKQGSGKPLSLEKGSLLTNKLIHMQTLGEARYKEAMDMGVAPEQARLFLPAYGVFVRYYWTASLQGVAHVLNQRLAKDAQKEFQLYAEAIYKLSSPKFEVSLKALVKDIPSHLDDKIEIADIILVNK